MCENSRFLFLVHWASDRSMIENDLKWANRPKEFDTDDDSSDFSNGKVQSNPLLEYFVRK